VVYYSEICLIGHLAVPLNGMGLGSVSL